MNASQTPSRHTPSPLAAVDMAPKDPILGVTETYVADQNPRKVNLGVGVYTDDDGKVPLLECVREAEDLRVASGTPKSYLPIDGLAAYDSAVQELVFSKESAPIREKRVVTLQALGGTGGLKIGADFLRQISPGATVWISAPSWENHRALFEGAGFPVKEYPYYHPGTHGLDFAGMLGALDRLPAGAIAVLHSCCHNPTGVDLTQDQWKQVLEVVKARSIVPFLDLAYQGFADGADADAYAPRLFAEATQPIFLSSSSPSRRGCRSSSPPTTTSSRRSRSSGRRVGCGRRSCGSGTAPRTAPACSASTPRPADRRSRRNSP